MLKLAISHGDPNGIGPEVVLKAVAATADSAKRELIVVGSRRVMEHHARALGLESVLEQLGIEEVEAVPTDVKFGEISAHAGSLAMAAVARACDLCLSGSAHAMVTAPISKEAIHAAGFDFPGHTEFLAERSGAGSPVMLMASDELRVALLTTHIPISQVAASITQEVVVEVVQRLYASLQLDFGITSPSIALLGLNPHAGDGGVLGREELDVLLPALESLRRDGIAVRGPAAADAFFGRRHHIQVDAVVACYHDQGLIPFKALAMGRGVNVTLGLPVVRTSPDHGTAFGIAGKNLADAGSMVAALDLAESIAKRRLAVHRPISH